jgi:DNA-directed RNA polymerase subunit beta'
LDNAIIKPNTSIVNSDLPYCLEIDDKDTFLLQCSPGNKISNSQIIAELIDSDYTTATGGIIKYSNLKLLDLESSKSNYPAVQSGTIFWIPEETHQVNKDISLLTVAQGEFTKAGTELIKDIYTHNDGYVIINQENGIIHDVTIKPGFLIAIASSDAEICDKEGNISRTQSFCRALGRKVWFISVNKTCC